jgi:aspartyl-tRNA(Asn)/glutamyl-tRNA(Gln) amidotransferase subunit C
VECSTFGLKKNNSLDSPNSQLAGFAKTGGFRYNIFMLTREEIEKISRLARVALDDKEKEKLAGELSAVIDYFEKLKKVDTRSVDLNLAETENTNQTRSDEALPCDRQEEILANAPAREERFIKVKSVL